MHGIDLQHEIKLDDPRPDGDTARGRGHADRSRDATRRPDKNTPAKNPYNPSFETGAVDFVKENPQADGRGVTIGIMDSGVDLGHPALQKTTTGERKIVDWVTATDPITDGDATWRAQITPVTGADVHRHGGTRAGRPRRAASSSAASASRSPPAATWRATSTATATPPTGSAVLYDAAAGTVRVDPDQDGDFTNDTADEAVQGRLPDRLLRQGQPGHRRRRAHPVRRSRSARTSRGPAGRDWVGKADFVNIGIIESEHGTHVAGITAANSLFGGKMNGEAPGAKLVSSRACTWSGGCTNIALTEGMIDLVVNRGVDIVNMSIGGLPALNDGNNARSELYKTSSTPTASSSSSRPATRAPASTPSATPASPTRSSPSAPRSPRRPGPPTTAPA